LKREVVDYEIVLGSQKEGATGLLTDIELKDLLNDVIPFEKMNQSFEYSN